VHLAAAVACGWWIDRGRFRSLLVATYGLFAAAFLLLDPPGALVAVTGPLYAVGISLYSVALVAYPSYGPEEPGRVPRRWRAALVYGVGGWLGSALGVGMAQNLHHVPRAFLAAAGALIVAGWALARSGAVRRLARAHAVTLLFGVAGVVVYGLGVSGPAPASAADAVAPEVLGRRVYVREGCIHCHSQYLRAGTRDVELWGPPQPPDPEATPPLYGNRRQGPDLSTVGLRRSAEWHRLHLIDPRSVVPSSRMPSYRHLFADGDPRGEALVAYLSSLGRGSEEEWNRLLREGTGG
jgi:cytochrome c oxidase cbb3-type subunit 2